ncbi:hypothetical protein EYF80_041834 [Liparis tanakae]|uniref:Uncharacterized protein n=1 Tax=Liparis tanakae TaxID=230148 RepID=A0A4Z2G5V3_9TELE|nr:hypothetical protein EYF80_041834 [Liparis tanakae]
MEERWRRRDGGGEPSHRRGMSGQIWDKEEGKKGGEKEKSNMSPSLWCWRWDAWVGLVKTESIPPFARDREPCEEPLSQQRSSLKAAPVLGWEWGVEAAVGQTKTQVVYKKEGETF